MKTFYDSEGGFWEVEDDFKYVLAAATEEPWRCDAEYWDDSISVLQRLGVWV